PSSARGSPPPPQPAVSRRIAPSTPLRAVHAGLRAPSARRAPVRSMLSTPPSSATPAGGPRAGPFLGIVHDVGHPGGGGRRGGGHDGFPRGGSRRADRARPEDGAVRTAAADPRRRARRGGAGGELARPGRRIVPRRCLGPGPHLA